MLENFNVLSQLVSLDFNIPLPHIILPLALSFVTFQQIAFLSDCYKNPKNAESKILKPNQILESKISSTQDSTNSKSQESSKQKKIPLASILIKHFNAESQNPDSKTQDSRFQESSDSINHINFLDYCLFITFFPQLIAGPIVHHKEMMPQYSKISDSQSNNSVQSTLESGVGGLGGQRGDKGSVLANSSLLSPLEKSIESKAISNSSLDSQTKDSTTTTKPKFNFNNFAHFDKVAKGLFIFSIGLFKKVCIADSFAKWADSGMSALRDSEIILNLFESWVIALSYTFQLYFDFSGYCDMAIGLGLLFGIVLPVNFYSPYKALSISDFWRRWHITLGRFLKDYIYIPLGGSRVRIHRNLCNLFIVFFLSGVWHGAGWGFIIWGILHGVAICTHKLYTLFYKCLKPDNLYRIFMQSKIYIALCWLATFVFIVVAWVFFRAENLQGALNLIKGMFFGAVVLPEFLESKLGFLAHFSINGVAISFDRWANAIDESSYIVLPSLLGALVVCVGFKNSVERIQSLKPLSFIIAGIAFGIAVIVLLANAQESPFLYFQF